MQYYNKSCTSLNLGASGVGYGARVIGLEGFSRVLWGEASYWAGGGEDEALLNIYRKGLKNGTDPSSSEYWGDLHDKDQRIVEMAAISYGLLISPDKLWYPLDEEAMDNLSKWLGQINKYQAAENNWQLFAVIANLALKKLGRPWSLERVEEAIEKYESYYLGNGWYSDGKRPQKDYYISFGIHFYCLLYTKFMEAEDPERAEQYISRAREFSRTFIYWFDEEGRALPFGRSQTYRFAQTAFWSACVLAGVECFPYGIMKGLIQRNLEYWKNQPILDNGGILTIGYAYPNLVMSENYNAPGSPYWALKAFVFLALPDEHEFWSAKSLPLQELDEIKLIKECDMLMCRRKKEVTALTAGQYPTLEHQHCAEKYAKYAYSTFFGFSVPRSYYRLEEAGTDNMLAFHVHGMHYVRRRCSEFTLSRQEVYSKWIPVEGIEVETWLIPVENGHLRRHCIISSLECDIYDCGFSYPDNMENMIKRSEKGYAMVGDSYGSSSVSADWGRGIVISSAPNTNLFYPNTSIPAISTKISVGETRIETRIETLLY